MMKKRKMKSCLCSICTKKTRPYRCTNTFPFESIKIELHFLAVRMCVCVCVHQQYSHMKSTKMDLFSRQLAVIAIHEDFRCVSDSCVSFDMLWMRSSKRMRLFCCCFYFHYWQLSEQINWQQRSTHSDKHLSFKNVSQASLDTIWWRKRNIASYPGMHIEIQMVWRKRKFQLTIGSHWKFSW